MQKFLKRPYGTEILDNNDLDAKSRNLLSQEEAKSDG